MSSCENPLQSSKALSTVRALLGPSPFHEPAEAGSPGTRQRTKVPGERHQRSHLHTCKGPFCLFFFFPFEISNSSLWTKSCLSENIDLRPLTKLHFKQSQDCSSPCPRTCLLSPWISQDHAENFALEHSTGTCTNWILFLMSAASFLGRTSGITR